MEPDFWHQRWEGRQIGFHLDDFNPHLQRFWPRVAPPQGARVFVPLCGKSLDMLWLARGGWPVIGVELSPIAVAEFFRDHGLASRRSQDARFQVEEGDRVRLLCGNFFDLTAADLGGVEAVYDRAALIALPPEMRQRYVDHLLAIVPPRASILLVTLDYAQEEMAGPPFAVRRDEVVEYFGGRYAVEVAHCEDALDERRRERGVTRLEERVSLLTPL